MSIAGNTAKLETTHSNIHTAQSSLSLVAIEPTMHSSQHTTESAHYPTIKELEHGRDGRL